MYRDITRGVAAPAGLFLAAGSQAEAGKDELALKALGKTTR